MSSRSWSILRSVTCYKSSENVKNIRQFVTSSEQVVKVGGRTERNCRTDEASLLLAHHPEAHVLGRRRAALDARVGRRVGAAAGWAALAVLRRHPLRRVAAEVERGNVLLAREPAHLAQQGRHARQV